MLYYTTIFNLVKKFVLLLHECNGQQIIIRHFRFSYFNFRLYFRKMIKNVNYLL